MKRWFALLLITALFLSTLVHAQEPLRVVATTTIIADVARNVGGDLVEVTALIPTDSDVHAFQITPEDAVIIAEADVLLVNGAGLEAFLGGLIENAGEVEPFVVSNGIEVLAFGEHYEEDHAEAMEEAHEDEDEHMDEAAEHVGVLGVDADCALEEEAHEEGEEEHEEGEEDQHSSCDPHVWTDPNNVKIWVTNIAEAFATADPANAQTYAANGAAYIEQLTALDAEVREILSTISDERRILVTNHEFFGYFAHAYDFEVVGAVIPGGSTLSEPDPQALAELVEIIRSEGVPAIFTEASTSDQLASIVAQETGINVVTTLYSDSLSAADPAATYLDYLRYNATTIADALS
jgi:ABC-type Zn uptake system ZnuABC Zn-binding protein ZnuA